MQLHYDRIFSLISPYRSLIFTTFAVATPICMTLRSLFYSTFGDVDPLVFSETNLAELCRQMYEKSPDLCVVPFHYLRRRAFLIRDSQMISQVLDSTRNFGAFIRPGVRVDPLLNKCSPFAIDSNDWELPVFDNITMKYAFKNVLAIAAPMHYHCLNKLGEKNRQTFDLKEWTSEFVNKVLILVGLGINNGDDDSPDDLRNAEKICSAIEDIFRPSWTNWLREIINLYAPGWVSRILNWRLVSNNLHRKIYNHVTTMLRDEKLQHGEKKNSLIHWIARSMGENVDEELVIRQVFAFLVESHEYLSIIASCAIFNLAQCSDIQLKALWHVQRELPLFPCRWSLEALDRVTYLDQIIEETIRMHPPVGYLARVCTNRIDLVNEESRCSVEEGDLVFVSSEGVHMDPRHWDYPDVFHPDRFNPRARQNSQGVLIPFDGSYANRFYRMAIKMMVATMLSIGNILTDPETPHELQIDRSSYVPRVEGRLCIRLDHGVCA